MVIKHIKKLLGIKPAEVTPEAPYKVEVPPVPAGTPLVNDAGKVVAIADGKPAKGPKVTSAKKTSKKKTVEAPVAETPAPKKPRAPRKPKTTNE